MVTPKPIEVAAALVFHKGRLLIAQRPPEGHLANLWEFPGGKREPGETFEHCLKREIQEELAIVIKPQQLLSEITHTYPEKTVHLQFFKCRWLSGQPTAIGCQAFEWVTREELNRFHFPAADNLLLEHLANTPDWWI